LTLLVHQQLIYEVASLQTATTIKLLPPLCPLAVSAADFSHAEELISRARRTSLRWIDSGGTEVPDPEQFLAAHHHRVPGTTACGAGLPRTEPCR
jgi:NTE family protein